MSLAVVCVQVGNYCGRGTEYVGKLRAAVSRHLTLAHSFYCVGDDIEPHPDLKGWWQKLYLFKYGLFKEDRILYFDLDTLILGSIDEIASFPGNFSALRDFYRPGGMGSGVMAWENGNNQIWRAYAGMGMPQDLAGGDQEFMEIAAASHAMRPHCLQDEYPGQIVSYKADCKGSPPKGARIVCFHGEPKNHNAPDQWVKDAWNGAERTRDVPAGIIQLPAHKTEHYGRR